jgi:hypothetical protein
VGRRQVWTSKTSEYRNVTKNKKNGGGKKTQVTPKKQSVDKGNIRNVRHKYASGILHIFETAPIPAKPSNK